MKRAAWKNMAVPRCVRASCLITAALAISVHMGAVASQGADMGPNREFARQSSWKMPTAAEVRERTWLWLATQGEIDPAVSAALGQQWDQAQENAARREWLDLVASTISQASARARALVANCGAARQTVALPDTAWLVDEQTPAFERFNLRLLYGRWLVHETLYDEAAVQLEGLRPEDVVDPAGLLFYQSVVAHSSLQRTPGLAAIARLLENESQVPRRYVSVARLMQADLEGLKEESLDHIARRMEDIRRRLELGRAGPKVRSVEDGVIESLDKLIDEMQKQQDAAAAAAAAAGAPQGTIRPQQPAPDSMPMGGKGPGQVADKPVGKGDGWGNLPPKARQEAMQQIGKDYPAHYRDVIEQYFRKLATSGENAEK